MNSTTTPMLEKKAIKAALQEDWEEAITLNKEIIETDPQDVNANVRLGRAYIQTKNFKDAEKIFKKVLEIDPIHPVALKNYKLAKEKKTEKNHANGTKSFIKEPGTTIEAKAEITARGLTANSFSYGTEFELNALKSKTNLLFDKKILGELTSAEICKRLTIAAKKNAKLKAWFMKGDNKSMTVLVEASEPVFKADKQDVKPYMKKGSIEEIEIEYESFDDDTEEAE